ncbi:hypothetical protein SUGI_0233850 [Cryptomeria japonica]|nr:hypothetical protein SUGI_0233850 [Cryptomeria japonica]
MATETVEHYLKNISSDVIKLGVSLLALAYFIYLIKSDAQQAYRKGAHWLPGNAFILSAFTIQLLSYLDMSTVNISDKPSYSEMILLLGNHLLIESQRLIICVFMGYLLPGMARHGSGGQWGDISALTISLITDITSELFFLHKSKDLFRLLTEQKTVQKIDYGYQYEMAEQFKQQPSIRAWFMVSSVGILVSVIFLILFLVCAILAGNTIRGVLSQRILASLPSKETEKSWKGFEEEVLRSWIVARACRPEYVIARSVLSSAAGMVVTLRIILSLLKFSYVQYKSVILRHDGLDELRKVRLVFQWVFVLIGWIAICWRWMTAVIYFPRLKNTSRLFTVEDFWTRAICQTRFGWKSSNVLLEEEISKANSVKSIKLRVYLCLLRSAQAFVAGFLIRLQSLVVLLGKICWFLSEIVIGKLLWTFTLGRKDLSLDSEFIKYRPVLKRIRMPGERPGSLWLANKKAFQLTKDRMQEGYKDAGEFSDLVSLISHRCTSSGIKNLVDEFESLPVVKAYFPNLDKMCWKMTAVSYLKIIVNIFPTSDRQRVDRAMKAFDQAKDFMNFLDSSEIEEANEMEFLDRLGMEADQMSKAADMEFNRLKYASTERNINIPPVEEIQNLMNSAQQLLKKNMLFDKDADTDDVGLQDSKDLTEIAPSYSLFRVCKHLLQNTGNDVMELEDLWNKIEDQLGNVFAYCVLQVSVQLVKKCRDWASDFEEEKIWDAVSIAGKVKWVSERCDAMPNWTEEQESPTVCPA